MTPPGDHFRKAPGTDLLVPPTHLPLPTLDNRQMMEMFKKSLGGTPGAMFGGGWSGGLTSRYRTGPGRLGALANSYGGTDDSVSWIFSCVTLVASTLASYPWRLADEEGETLDAPPADLVGLLERPNAEWTYFDLAEAVATDLELVGNAYLVRNEVNGLGQPKSLLRLPPETVRIAVSADGVVRGYVYTPRQGYAIPFDVDEVIHFKYPNPLDIHYGMGTVEAISSVLDQHVAEGQHITGFFQNGGRISGVLTVPETLSDTQFERMKESYRENYAGPANAYKVLIAEGTSDYKPITQGPAAAGVVELMNVTKDEVLSAFGIPEPLLGGRMENANYKMEESQHIFLRAMIPRARRFAERITLDLARYWDIHFHVDPHANEPLDVRIAHAKEMLGAGGTVNEAREAMGQPPSDEELADAILIPNGLIPLSIVGEPPRPGRSIPMGVQGEPGAPPEGSEPAAGNGAAPTLADHMGELPEALRNPKGFAEEVAKAIEEGVADRVSERLAALAREQKAVAEARRDLAGERPAAPAAVLDAPPAPAKPADRPSRAMSALAATEALYAALPSRRRAGKDWEPPVLPPGFETYDGKRTTVEQQAVREHQARVLTVGVLTFLPAFRGFFKGQRDRVLQALSQYHGGRRGARLSATATLDKKELTAEAIFNLEAENEALRNAYLPALGAVGALAASSPPNVTGNLVWDEANPRIEALRERLAAQVVRINETTRSAISDQVTTGLQRGYSVSQIANGFSEEKYPGLQGVFDSASDLRAETIARTEAAYAFGAVTAAAYQDAGVQYVEIMDGTDWDSECSDADGSVWTLEEYDENLVEHPNAVFEGAWLLPLGELQLGYAADWCGPAVLLRTAGAADQWLAVTPNHPVLTGRGWIPAREVKEGDHVVRSGRKIAAGRVAGLDLDDVPALAEEILAALRPEGLSFGAVPAASDLHGDARFVEGEVEVVVPDGSLLGIPHAPFVEESRELALAGAGVEHPSFARAGSRLLRGERVPLAASSPLGTAAGDAPLTEALSDEVRADAQLLRDLSMGFALAVELDDVVEVRFERERRGHIYDLQTAGRAYFADGILLSNCTRAASPSDVGPDGQQAPSPDAGAGE